MNVARSTMTKKELANAIVLDNIAKLEAAKVANRAADADRTERRHGGDLFNKAMDNAHQGRGGAQVRVNTRQGNKSNKQNTGGRR